jgi:hypothetical protein
MAFKSSSRVDVDEERFGVFEFDVLAGVRRLEDDGHGETESCWSAYDTVADDEVDLWDDVWRCDERSLEMFLVEEHIDEVPTRENESMTLSTASWRSHEAYV